MSEDLTREDVHERLDRFVLNLLAESGVSQPPIDALTLAQRQGVALRLDPDLDEEARQGAAALALGEHLRSELLRCLGVDPSAKRSLLGESPVTLFADRLLTPTPWLLTEGRAAGWDLLSLKQRFTTASHEHLAWRLLDLPEPCVITIVEAGRVVRRRSNAWRVTKRLSAPETRLLALMDHDGCPHELSEEGWRVQGWPVSRDHGKRAILRSVVEEY